MNNKMIDSESLLDTRIFYIASKSSQIIVYNLAKSIPSPFI